MGKRSAFKRVERDAYNTPPEAVDPLLPWLTAGTRFIEPCYGTGALADTLKAAGHVLMGGFDLPIDARTHQYGELDAEVFITNPPYWGRPDDLHQLIENLSAQAPSWLLMSADWLFNLGSAPIMPRLHQIVAVGRVRWIPGSPYSSKDNAAWMRFDVPTLGHTTFVGRRRSFQAN